MKAGLLVLALAASAATAQVRPQLEAAEAARYSVAAYPAQGPAPWQPAVLHGQDTGPAPALGSANARHVIHIRPGVYRERLCIQGKGPLTLVGDPADAGAVRIVGSAYSALPKRPGIDAAHPCHPELAAATVVVASPDFQALHLTVENDALAAVRHGLGYPAGAGESGGAQAVALTRQADRVQLENVRLLGHQDTLLMRRPGPDAPARVYLHGSLIAVDVDFIFGNGTLVIDRSTVLSRAGRRTPGEVGHVLAPSTPASASHGFLVTHSRFAAEPGLAPGSHSLGRAWDAGGEWDSAYDGLQDITGQSDLVTMSWTTSGTTTRPRWRVAAIVAPRVRVGAGAGRLPAPQNPGRT